MNALLLAGFFLVADPPPSRAISGEVRGASGSHAVLVSLWSAEGFLERPVQQIKLEPSASKRFSFRVAPGRWSVSAFEDRNDNTKLDMGLFGPKEPSGFWRAFHAWRKPRFEDVSVLVERDISDADVQLK